MEEEYEALAEILTKLSKRGETIVLHPGSVKLGQMISGFSGGVKWDFATKTWQAYSEG